MKAMKGVILDPIDRRVLLQENGCSVLLKGFA
jgi:hypothetical protein